MEMARVFEESLDSRASRSSTGSVASKGSDEPESSDAVDGEYDAAEWDASPEIEGHEDGEEEPQEAAFQPAPQDSMETQDVEEKPEEGEKTPEKMKPPENVVEGDLGAELASPGADAQKLKQD